MISAELSGFLGHWLPRLEDEMQTVLHNDEAAVALHYGMMQYHLGWVDKALRRQNFPTGKRLRPLLCLLACAEVGGDPGQALPAAAAIEILHNFSLVHDDIEDGDEVRRHRPTVWKIWGIPQAINAGDGMFTLAFAALQRLSRRGVSAEQILRALANFTECCLALTEGQHLDMNFEQRLDIAVPEYLRMVQGKTAALVGCSSAIGALLGGATPVQVEELQRFGQSIGLAFQIQDDILGIWGDSAVTGKAAGNDILRRKKSLPILYTINHAQVGAAFTALLTAADLGPAQLPQALALLDAAGARSFAAAQVQAYHTAGLTALAAALGDRYTTSALFALCEGLLDRQA